MGKTNTVTHKRVKPVAGNLATKTACGISLFDVKKSNPTYRGVTCLRCLGVRRAAEKKAQARKAKRRTIKQPVKRTQPKTCTAYGGY